MDVLNDYLYAGNDRVVFGEGVSVGDVLFGSGSTSGSSLPAIYVKSQKSLLAVSSIYDIEFIEFSDGTVCGTSEIRQRMNSPSFRVNYFAISTGLFSSAVSGTAGVDFLIGADSRGNVLNGYGGNDHLVLLRGDGSYSAYNYAYGGDDNDWLEGSSGVDYLYGENGNDLIQGGGGSDYIFGGAGNDVLEGGGRI